jgi:hypothetical protein
MIGVEKGVFEVEGVTTALLGLVIWLLDVTIILLGDTGGVG